MSAYQKPSAQDEPNDMPVAPLIRSKDSYNSDDDPAGPEDDPADPGDNQQSEDDAAAVNTKKHFKGVPELTHLDSDLRWSVCAAEPKIAAQWLEGVLKSAKPDDDLEPYRTTLKSDTSGLAAIQTEVWEQYTKQLARSGTQGKERAALNKEIGLDSEIFDHVINHAFKTIKDSKARPLRTGAEGNRDEINRITDLMKSPANYYDLFKVEKKAPEKDIKASWRKILAKIHSDKNNDEDAKACTQYVNNAKEILLDKTRRKEHDRSLPESSQRNTKTAHSEHEDLHKSAFDGKDDSGKLDEDDPPPPLEVSPPSAEIRSLQRKAWPHFKCYFSRLEGDTSSQLGTIEKINNQISQLNKKAKIDETYYQIWMGKMKTLQQTQRTVATTIRNGEPNAGAVTMLYKSLKDYFTTECAGKECQWPAQWIMAITQPIDELIKQCTTQNDGGQGPKPSTPKDDTKSGTQPGKNPDVNMKDAPPVHPKFGTKSDHQSGNNLGEEMQSAPLIRQLQLHRPVKPGYTILGDKILAYQPTEVRFRITNTRVITRWRFFIEVEGPNPLRTATGSEIGDAEALAYHNLPVEQKTDVRDTKGTYKRMYANRLGKIKGVTWQSGPGTESGMPDLWLYVELKDSTDDDDSEMSDPTLDKPNILTRSEFGYWQGTLMGDKLIDMFLVNNGIVPPWAGTKYPDPKNQGRYLALTYPAPRAHAYHTPSIPMQLAQGGTNYMRQLPPATQTHMQQLTPATQTHMQHVSPSTQIDMLSSVKSDIDTINDRFSQLMIYLIEDKKEQRAERERDREEREKDRNLLLRLLPPPNP